MIAGRASGTTVVLPASLALRWLPKLADLGGEGDQWIFRNVKMSKLVRYEASATRDAVFSMLTPPWDEPVRLFLHELGHVP